MSFKRRSKYEIKNDGKKDKENEEELLANYPIMADEVIYVLRDTTKDNVKKTMERYFEEAGYTYEDFEKDKALDSVMKMVLEMRAKARAEKDWATCDAIRDELNAAGIVVKDTPDGAIWEI